MISQENICAYSGCTKRITNPKYFLCTEHHEDRKDGLIDQCPKCGRFKSTEYKQCLDCYHKRPIKHWTPPTDFSQPKPQSETVNIEHSKKWERGDKDIDRFYAYILKLDGGVFYIGHTRELRERISEHLDGTTASTKGLNPKLQYFEILPTREEAVKREAELKKLVETNNREIRRMIISFQDLIRELNYD
jgi:predicted GIY-YIG superfamily endonuclease